MFLDFFLILPLLVTDRATMARTCHPSSGGTPHCSPRRLSLCRKSKAADSSTRSYALKAPCGDHFPPRRLGATPSWSFRRPVPAGAETKYGAEQAVQKTVAGVAASDASYR